jgi:hypothetical protein
MNSSFTGINIGLESMERAPLASVLRKSLATASSSGVSPEEIKKAQELQAHIEGRAVQPLSA